MSTREQFYAGARTDRSGPLDGVRVLEATSYGAGPFCGTVLADFGAESIKIEPPGRGDPVRQLGPFVGGQPGADAGSWYLSINRNKRGITLDLRQAEGREVFRELLAQVDILVENFTPGVMGRWGLDYVSLSADFPRLIYVSVSGFGQFGPWHHRKGFDPVAQAMGGLMSVTGERGGPPLRAGFAIADDLSGWLGAMGAMAALHHRERCGEGQHVDSSLVDAVLYASDMGVMGAANTDEVWQRTGASVDSAGPLNSYACADGRYVFLHAVFDSAWRGLCEAMQRPDLIDDVRTRDFAARAGHLPFVDEVVGEWAATQSVEAVVEQADQLGFVAGPILDFGEICEQPHYRERESVTTVEHPEHGELTLYGVSPKFSRTPARVRGAAPQLGADNDAIYRGLLGYSDDRVAALHERGVI